jgi:HptB-dependent secretion and biofilm anti anti-sigma factor
MKMDYSAEYVATLQLGEAFDFDASDQFRKAYEQVDLSRAQTFNIDFSHTKYIDSFALGMLLNMKSFFAQKALQIKFINTKDQIKKIFLISRFDQKFDIE